MKLKEIKKVMNAYLEVIGEIHDEGMDLDDYSEDDINNMILGKIGG